MTTWLHSINVTLQYSFTTHHRYHSSPRPHQSAALLRTVHSNSNLHKSFPTSHRKIFLSELSATSMMQVPSISPPAMMMTMMEDEELLRGCIVKVVDNVYEGEAYYVDLFDNACSYRRLHIQLLVVVCIIISQGPYSNLTTIYLPFYVAYMQWLWTCARCYSTIRSIRASCTRHSRSLQSLPSPRVSS